MQIWLTGFPCAGKTTLALRLALLIGNVIVLDGDELRKGLCSDLGFTEADRKENIRRTSELACFLERRGHTVIVALVAPYRRDRELARLRAELFVEVYVKADIENCISRDVKGMYAEARAGKRKNFTGLDAIYERPMRPELTVQTDVYNVEECSALILGFLEQYRRETFFGKKV